MTLPFQKLSFSSKLVGFDSVYLKTNDAAVVTTQSVCGKVTQVALIKLKQTAPLKYKSMLHCIYETHKTIKNSI